MLNRKLEKIFTAQFKNGGRGELDPVLHVPLYDCWGLVMAVHAVYGVQLPDFGVPADDSAQAHAEWNRQHNRRDLWRECLLPQVPAIVVMKTDTAAPDACSHFGTFIGDGRFVHIADQCKVHSSEVRLWMPKIEEFRIWIGGSL